MKRVSQALLGICEFIAGDDWLTAAGVVLALGLTGVISTASTAWFVMPVAVAILLALSVWRQRRRL